jgi:multidrug resistance efflux pump
LAQLGDYANVGKNEISLVDADSFWIDGYFEETNLEPIQVGDPASIKLMGYSQIFRGHVDSIARGITVSNAQPNGQELGNVNPIFTWVRLAQRIPVRIQIDEVPEDVVLTAGNDRHRADRSLAPMVGKVDRRPKVGRFNKNSNRRSFICTVNVSCRSSCLGVLIRMLPLLAV